MPILDIELIISTGISSLSGINNMVTAMTGLYKNRADITLNAHRSRPSGMPFSVDVGTCDLDNPQPTASQIDLFNSFGANSTSAVVSLFVEQLNSSVGDLLGCAVHPNPSKLRSVIGSNAGKWVLAHEVSHNLGLEHDSDDSNLMYSVPDEIVEPVKLTSAQVAILKSHFSEVSGFMHPLRQFAIASAENLELPESERLRPIRSRNYTVVPLLRTFEQQVQDGEGSTEEIVHLVSVGAEIPQAARGDRVQSVRAALRVLEAASDQSRPTDIREAAADAAWKLGRCATSEDVGWRLAHLVARLKQDDSRRVRRAAARSAETLRLGYASAGSSVAAVPSAEPIPLAEPHLTPATILPPAVSTPEVNTNDGKPVKPRRSGGPRGKKNE